MLYIPDSIAANSSFQQSLLTITLPAIKSPCVRSHMFQTVTCLVNE